MSVRSSGILLHPTSLPSPYGIGDLGPSAYRFADFLNRAGQRRWQVLPLNPTTGAHGHSPYYCPSAFAGNPLLISPQILVSQGLLQSAEAETPASAAPPPTEIDYRLAVQTKQRLLLQACRRFVAGGEHGDYQRFCRHQAGWLDDFALYTVLRSHHRPRAWYEWPQALRDRDPDALAQARQTFKAHMEAHKILQFLFMQQWLALKSYCNQRHIQLIGDMPIYVPLDSADVWTHRSGFKLTRSGRPLAVSGVPPDYFSATGQLWGHPVYDWEALRHDEYRWWVARVQHHLQCCDVTRIDHFRGLVAYWEVPAEAETAATGRWVPVPTQDLFDRLIKRLGNLPVIAEDLGSITAEVREAIRNYRFPGMRVLQFAFGGDFPNSDFLPHRHASNTVVYTGTHDNNTTRGWFDTEADQQIRKNLFSYLGREVAAGDLPWELIRLAMLSIAGTAIVPLQDILGLGSEARMNHPGRSAGNWRWRYAWSDQDADRADRLREMTACYGRL
jgi:4-alpha-glucanotransferase